MLQFCEIAKDMKAYAFIYILGLQILTSQSIKPIEKQCLNSDNVLKWERLFDMNNQVHSLKIEATNRASHMIANNILSILLRERLGYRKIEFNSVSWDDAASSINRLSLGTLPESIINLEVWMGPGFNVESWVNRKKVIDCGPLGPIARRGIFVPSSVANQYFEEKQISLDYWKVFGHDLTQNFSKPKWFEDLVEDGRWSLYSNYSGAGPCQQCLTLLIDNEFKPSLSGLLSALEKLDPTRRNMAVYKANTSFDLWEVAKTLSHSEAEDSRLFFLSWYPNTVTVKGNFNRLSFPDCNSPSVGSINELIDTQSSTIDSSQLPDGRPQHCFYEINQLTKVVWEGLQEHASLAFDLIDRMYFTQETYNELLRQVNVSDPNKSLNEQYFDIACGWLKSNFDVWSPWTKGWDDKKTLVIGGMFALQGKWMVDNLPEESQIAVDDLNKEVFGNTQYKIEVSVRNLTCAEDQVLNDYLEQLESITERQPLIGIVAALCSDSIEPMVKLSNLQHRIIISPTVESDSFKAYPYFFRTVPTLENYNYLFVKACETWHWKHVVVLRKDDHFIASSELTKNGQLIVSDNEHTENSQNYDKVYKILEKVKDTHRIFLTEYFANCTKMIMCAAYRLKMTSRNGYVWFHSPWLGPRWWQGGYHETNVNCTEKEIENATQGYFMINHEDHIPPDNLYTFYTYRAVKALGYAVSQLLNTNKSALSALTSEDIAETFKEKIEKLKVRDVVRNFSVRSNESRALYFTQRKPQNNYNWKVFQHIIGESNHVITALNMRIINFTDIPIIKVDDRKKVKWQTRDGKRPTDGHDSPCAYDFLAELLDVSCQKAAILFYVIVAVMVVLIIVGFIIYYYKKQQKKREKLERKPYDELCAELQPLDMPSTNIVLNRRVGQGAFGLVYGGEAKNKQNNKWESIAVKVLNSATSPQGKVDFLSEAKLMNSLNHDNIVRIIGICLHPPQDQDCIYLVMEFMLHGDLKTYLLSRRTAASTEPDHEDIRPSTLTKFAVDIASGIEYMHNNHLIHRDIACRNCLVGSGHIVKIGDFGLTRQMRNNKAFGYYRFTKNCELPVRWMSPEAIQFGTFTIQSDIWSYGIVLYEIITFGVFPYDGLGDVEVVEKVKRYEFSIGEFIPRDAHGTYVSDLILSCCKYKAEDRPRTMGDVIRRLRANDTCVRPFLTEEPPKPPTLPQNPFQPSMLPELPKPSNTNKFRSKSKGPPAIQPDSVSGPSCYDKHDIGLSLNMKPHALSTEYLPLTTMSNKGELSASSAPESELDVTFAAFSKKVPKLPCTRHSDQSNGYLNNSEERETLITSSQSVHHIV